MKGEVTPELAADAGEQLPGLGRLLVRAPFPAPGEGAVPPAAFEAGYYQRVADRLARLQALTAALAGARTLTEVADVIIDQALPALEAEVGVVAVLSDDGKALRNVGFKGVPVDTEEAWREYPLESPVPVAEAALTRQPIIVTTIEERNRRYPVLAQVHGVELGGAVTTFPLLADGRLLGALGFCFPCSRDFDRDDLAFLQTLADQCALAVERARLNEVARREIESRRRSEEMLRAAQDRLRLALSSAHMIAWDWDLVTNQVSCSEAAGEIWGFASGDGEEFLQRIAPEDRPDTKRATERALAGEAAYSVEFRITGADGRTRWLYSLGDVQRGPDGEARGLTGVSFDITDRKEAEAALRQSARRKDEFLAMLAHELRNPLAPIRNAAEVLRQIGVSDRRIAQMRDVIDRQSAHMARIVDDLLDVSRVTQGRLLLRKERLDLVELLRATAGDHRAMLEAAGLCLELSLPERPAWVLADATRISQAVANLLHNSQKFTDRGGRVAMALAIDDAGKSAEVRVSDTGMGMEPELLAYVFEPFTQADATLDRSRGGMGLGLALVKGLAELHGGGVSAWSAGPGQGSTFTLRLPLLDEP